MENTLIISVLKKDISWLEIEKKIEIVFESKPESISLPINEKLMQRMDKTRGEMRTYKLFYGSDIFANAVFQLLITLEEFGYDWKFRKPVQIFPPKFLFMTSLFPEHGEILVKGITGMTVQLFEGKEAF